MLGSLALLVGAFVVRYALQPLIEPYAPFHFFIVACLFIAYLYGYQLALLATLISALAGSFFFVKPYLTLGPAALTDVIQFINFASVTAISVLIIEKLQRTIYARQIVLKILESRHKISLHRENDRIYFSKVNNEAWAVLDEILTDFDDIILIQHGPSSVKLEPLFMALAVCPTPILSADEWQSLIHSEDISMLLFKLSQPITKSGQMDEFVLRFASHVNAAHHRVALESFVFLGKPLRILRLAGSDA